MKMVCLDTLSTSVLLYMHLRYFTPSVAYQHTQILVLIITYDKYPNFYSWKSRFQQQKFFHCIYGLKSLVGLKLCKQSTLY